MSDLNEKKGLWDNIRAKRARGERPARKGEKDFPDAKSWKKAQGKGKGKGKKESAMYMKKKIQESQIVESVSNLLRDKANLGLPGNPKYKERFSLSQKMMEDMYEEFALKFVDSPFYESVTRAFRKIHSYKYVSNPTFKLSLISELRSTAVPEEVIEETCKAIDSIMEKNESEKDVNWNNERLSGIVDMTRNANRRDIKHEDPFNTPLSESSMKYQVKEGSEATTPSSRVYSMTEWAVERDPHSSVYQAPELNKRVLSGMCPEREVPGNANAPIVTSPIVSFDPKTRIAKTRSGTEYRLDGPPSAEYADWCNENGYDPYNITI